VHSMRGGRHGTNRTRAHCYPTVEDSFSEVESYMMRCDFARTISIDPLIYR
jgi:hypothetical protein